MGAGDMKLAEGLKDMIVTADESLSSAIESAGFGEKGKAIVEGTAKGIDENKDKAVKSATDMAKDIDKGTKDTLGIHSPSTVFAEHGQNLVLGLIQGITKSTAEALNSTRQFSKSVIDTSDNTIREGRGRLFNAGRFIGLGLANGLESTRGSIMATARSIANAAASTMRKALKIKSPSRVGVEIGEFTGEGLDIGLANKIKDVKRTSDMLAMSAVPDVNTKQVYDIAIKGGGNATTTNSTVFNVDKIIWQGKEDIRKTMDEMGWIAGQEKWRLQTT